MNGPRIRILLLASPLVPAMALVMIWVLFRGAPTGVFTLHEGRVYAEQGTLRLDDRLDVTLPDQVLEALNSGVPLVFTVQLHVVERRPWLWDRLISDLGRSYRLRFHTLSRSYLLTRLDTGKRSVHHLLSSAFHHMGNHRGAIIARLEDLKPERDYEVRLRIRLDEADLPSPLQVPILFTDAWNIDSRWYRWRWSP